MIKGMTIGVRSGKFSLLLGLTLGVVAAALIVVYLSGAKSEGGTASVSGPSVPVVVASDNIAAGTRITAEMVGVKDLPDTSVLAGAFDKLEAVVGQVTVVPVVAGEQIIQGKVTATGAAAITQYGENPPLSLLLESGQRALSVEITSLVGAGGLIRPGDRVDVILTVKTKSDAGSNQIAATVLQNIKVLAIDQNVAAQTSAADGTSTIKEGEDTNPTATTVTFAATPVQGEVLALADMCRTNFEGRLAISLRGFGDESTISRTQWANDGPPPDCAALLGIAGLP
jgi:pilus assembly protein CpaB